MTSQRSTAAPPAFSGSGVGVVVAALSSQSSSAGFPFPGKKDGINDGNNNVGGGGQKQSTLHLNRRLPALELQSVLNA